MQVVHEGIPAVESSGTKREGTFRRYLAWLLLPSLAVYLAGFALVRLPSYERWGGSRWAPTLEYAFQTAGQNADIVIFGDSSALYAVDPVQMGRDLGLKAINLPNTMGSLPVLDDLSLQFYLAHNPPPKIIVFYMGSWNLDYRHPWGTRLFEGEEMLVRHGSWSQILQYALYHPFETFYFPFRVYSGLGPGAIKDLLRPSHAVPEVVPSHGHITNDLPVGPLAGDCKFPPVLTDQDRTDSVRALISKYSTPQTTTMLYLAPVPGCQNVKTLLTTISSNITHELPAVLAPGDFSADSMYAHLRPNAVPAATELLTVAVRSRLNSDSGAQGVRSPFGLKTATPTRESAQP